MSEYRVLFEEQQCLKCENTKQDCESCYQGWLERKIQARDELIKDMEPFLCVGESCDVRCTSPDFKDRIKELHG